MPVKVGGRHGKERRRMQTRCKGLGRGVDKEDGGCGRWEIVWARGVAVGEDPRARRISKSEEASWVVHKGYMVD